MKVENVERIQNNPDNFVNAGAERDAAGKGQFGNGNLQSANVSDIIDINADPEITEKTENLYSGNSQNNSEKSLYNDKGTKIGDNSVNKTLGGVDGKTHTEVQGKNDLQSKAFPKENPYSSASSNMGEHRFDRRDYGLNGKLDTFSNPDFNAEKSIFYNEKNTAKTVRHLNEQGFQTQEKIFFDIGERPEIITNTKISGNIKNSISDNATENSVLLSNNAYKEATRDLGREIENTNFENETLNFTDKKIGNFANRKNKNFELNGKTAEDTPKGYSGRSGMISTPAEDEPLTLTERIYNVDNEIMSGIPSKNSDGKTYGRVWGQNEALADVNQENYEVRNGLKARKNAGNGFETNYERTDLSGSDNRISLDGEPISGYERNIISSRKHIGNDTKDDNSDIETRRAENEETVRNRNFASAQLAYQNIISKTAVDIYGKTPGLEKLIAMLFKIRKLTVKRVDADEKNIDERFEKIETETKKMLGEVKNFVNKGDYKSGKALEAFDRFSDDLEKIKYCVGLSPFAAGTGNYIRYFEEVKSEIEDIRSELVRRRRNEILRAVFRIILLAFGVAMIYLAFLR